MVKMEKLLDPKNDEIIREALKSADRQGKLGVVATMIGISRGEKALREIMVSTCELNVMDRGMLALHLLENK